MKQQTQVGAAEFKAKCLELIDEVHDRKRDEIIITKRGKPFAKLVPADEPGQPFYGCAKGMVTVLCDLTEPMDVEWEAMKD